MCFKWKTDETGKMVKAKARLEAKGLKQKYGVDFRETFSPSAKAISMRLVVKIALACKYKVESLHGILSNRLFSREPRLNNRLCVNSELLFAKFDSNHFHPDYVATTHRLFPTALMFGALALLPLSYNSVFFFNVAQPSQRMCVAHSPSLLLMYLRRIICRCDE